MRIEALFVVVLLSVMNQTFMVSSLNIPKEAEEKKDEGRQVIEMPFESKDQIFDTQEQKEDKPKNMEVDGYYTDLEKRSKELADSALNNALKGYDIVNGEPYNCLEGNSVDPGMKLQIFDRGPKTFISKVTTCTMTTQSTVVTTLNQFRSATGSSSVEGEGFGFERTGEVSVSDPSGVASVTADYEVSADVAFSNSKSSSKVASYFQNSKGAIAMTSATCLIDKVQISDYHLPDFTVVFKSAVEELASAEGSQRNAAFKKFINTYGTHYMTQAVLGAKLMLTSFLTEDARRDFSREKIEECTKNSGGFNFFGIKYSKNSQKCSSSDEAKFTSTGEYVSHLVIHSYGSMPATSLTDWASQDFDPLPIKMKLKPIYELFETKHFQKQGMNVDADKLRNWVYDFYKEYCTVMGFPCGKNDKLGCGYTDTCKLNERCIDEGEKGKVKCVVDGKWTSWGNWGRCSTPCGRGTQFRFRECVEPSAGGRRNCEGKVYSTRTCMMTTPCADDDVRSVRAWSSSVHEGRGDVWGAHLAWNGGSTSSTGFFHSEQERNPWLRIQLSRAVEISYITITNRKDGSGDRLRNLEIRGGMRNDLTNPVIGYLEGPGATGGVYRIDVTPIKVLYLSFQLKVDSGTLQINGIRVGFTKGIWADVRAVDAWASSVYWGQTGEWGPQHAWTGGSINSVGFFHSQHQRNPWLRIKLNRAVVISFVIIRNRFDGDGQRMSNIEIRGGMRNDLTNPVIGHYDGPGTAGGIYQIQVTPTRVLYLSFQRKVNSGVLQMNGIKVGFIKANDEKAENIKEENVAYIKDESAALEEDKGLVEYGDFVAPHNYK